MAFPKMSLRNDFDEILFLQFISYHSDITLFQKGKQMSQVLLVDDESFFLDAIGSTLKSEFSDIEVLEASDGKSAWNIYKKFKPDLVITDYKMPNWNGAELSKAIHERDKNLPVVLITGFAEKVESELFSDVLLKPFQIDELINVAKKHL